MRRRRPLGVATLLVLVLLLAWPGGVQAARGDKPRSERGVVQAVSASELVLKALDGSTVVVAIDSKTKVTVDGRQSTITALQPGFVALVSFKGADGKPAREVEAFSTSTTVREESVLGVLRSVSGGLITVTRQDGRVWSAALTASTRILIDGKAAPLQAVRAWSVAVARATVGTPPTVRELFVFSPTRARAPLYRGTVVSVHGRSLTVRAAGGTILTITLAGKVKVMLNGAEASLQRLRSDLAVVVRGGSHPEIWAFGDL